MIQKIEDELVSFSEIKGNKDKIPTEDFIDLVELHDKLINND